VTLHFPAKTQPESGDRRLNNSASQKKEVTFCSFVTEATENLTEIESLLRVDDLHLENWSQSLAAEHLFKVVNRLASFLGN
jgi:hypothetical protein